MKTLITWIAAALLFAGCGGNNDYDGETSLLGTGSSADTETALQQINDLVLTTDVVLLAQQARQTRETIRALQSDQNASALADAQLQASALFSAWKRVEALYFAGDYNTALIDTPAYIDSFNIGNIDIPTRLDEIFAGSSALSGQLYQSTTRSMGALEYTLYGYQEGPDVNMTQRRADAAGIMIDYLLGHIEGLESYYAASDDFVTAGEDSVGIVINQLIDSIYKLREWRIGDPAGYTVKYEEDPDPTRLEYYMSQRSLENLRVILEAQLAVFEAGLSTIAAGNSAQSEADACVALLRDAIAQTRTFSQSLETAPASAASRELYNTAYSIQTSYTALINALNFKQDIIEADGD